MRLMRTGMRSMAACCYPHIEIFGEYIVRGGEAGHRVFTYELFIQKGTYPDEYYAGRAVKPWTTAGSRLTTARRMSQPAFLCLLLEAVMLLRWVNHEGQL